MSKQGRYYLGSPNGWRWEVLSVLSGVAANGNVHGWVKPSPGESSHGQGNHISGREGFWAYLPRRLAAKGGLSQERLALYLAEYVWRYNHRNASIQ